jgi:hypothetical protein
MSMARKLLRQAHWAFGNIPESILATPAFLGFYTVIAVKAGPMDVLQDDLRRFSLVWPPLSHGSGTGFLVHFGCEGLSVLFS